MATLKIKIDERSKTAKTFLEYIKTLSFVTVYEADNSTYDPKFVAKIKNRVKNSNPKDLVTVNPDNPWESIK